MFLQASVILFTGGVAWSRGVPGPGGLLLGGVPGPQGGSAPRGVPGPGGAWGGAGGDPPPPGRPLLRAVRILLECILVHYKL